MGTVLYMSPEQAMAKRIPLDYRTDVYSLGATMYEVLTGEPPFRGKDQHDTLSQIIVRDPRPPRHLNPRVLTNLETVVLKCLRKDPPDRYGTAEALAQDLRRFVRGDPIEARPFSGVERLAQKWARHRRSILRWAVMLLLAVGCAVAGSKLWLDARDKAREEYRQAIVIEKLKLLRGRTTIDGEEGASALDLISMFAPEDLARLAGDPVEEAVKELRVLAGAHPERFEAHYYQAVGFRLLGQRDEVAEHSRRALELAPWFVPARVLGDEIGGREDWADTQAWLNNNPSARWQRLWVQCYVAAEKEDWEGAEHAYSALITLDRKEKDGLYPGSWLDLRLGRAFARLDAGRLERALVDLAVVTDRWPGLVEPALLLGKVFHLLGHPDATRATFHSLYRETDQKAEAAAWIAVVYISLGENALALEWAERLESTQLASLRARLRAYCYDSLGDPAKARQAAEEAIRLDPRDSMAQFSLASLTYWKAGLRRRRVGDLEEVIRRCKKAIEFRPRFASARVLLARALYEAGNVDEALNVSREALAINRGDWRPILYSLFLFHQAGRVEELRALLGRIEPELDEFPLFPRAHVLGYRAYVLKLDGHFDKAIAEYERAWSIDGTHFNFFCLRDIGEILCRRGEYAQAIPYFRDAIVHGRREFLDDVFAMIAASHERLGKPAEAVRVLCEALVSDPGDALSHDALIGCLRRHGRNASENGVDADLGELLLKLETEEGGEPVGPEALRTLAFLRLHVPKLLDVEKARWLAERAVSASERRDPEALATLAEALAFSGDLGGAVHTLEEAMRLEGLSVAHRRLLDDARGRLFPDFLSFASIDAALLGRDPEEDSALLEAFDSAASGPHVETCRNYLEGRVLQRRGDFEAATQRFKRLTQGEVTGVESHLRLAESLREAGNPSTAEKNLRDALPGREPDVRRVWDLWVSLCLDDLGLKPRQVLERMPRPAEGTTVDDGAYAPDIRWLLEQLEAGNPLRINCGGDDHVAPSDEAWGRDRFFRGGQHSSRTLRRVVVGTDDLELYQNHRLFGEEEDSRGYRVPLPRGDYEVDVYVFEERLQDCPEDVVELHLEDRAVLELEGCAQWLVRFAPAIASAHTFRVPVVDGALDLDFGHGGTARISAIEIRPLR